MSLFSQRKGLIPVKKAIQIAELDDETRRRIWNIFRAVYFHYLVEVIDTPPELSGLLRNLWHNFLKLTIDDLVKRGRSSKYTFLKDIVLGWAWNGVLDFIEFVSKEYVDETTNETFREQINIILEEESTVYRFVGKNIMEITSEEEIEAIEEALRTPLTPVQIHIKTALELLSNRESPDYRNSIKESISAIESLCTLLVGKRRSFHLASDELVKKFKIHRTLEQGFLKIYGWTSEEGGIRHALLDDPQNDIQYDDAKFMLVSCSAFVNYIISKAQKIGHKF